MRVLLINPPREHMIRWTVTDWELDLGEISSFPPLGLMYLASYLKEHTHHVCRIIDAVAEKMNYEDLKQGISAFGPDIVGITSFTFTFYDVLQTAKIVKEVDPAIHVCLGGPHTWLFPDEIMSHPEFDSLVIGDGEIAFKELLDRLEQGDSFGDIDWAVVYREGDKTVRTGKTRYIANLDDLPFPAFDLLDGTKYYATFGKSSTMATIVSSRGCPFRCTYCQVLDKKYRTRSSENIVQELLVYYDKGIRDFYFFDDMFNITSKRVIEISERILESRMGGNIRWLFRGRMIKKHGIETSTNWIIGFPHHKSRKDIDELIDTAIQINSDYAQFSILQLFPGSEMFEECVREGSLTADRWSNFVKHPPEIYHIELYTKFLSAQELSEIYKEAHIRYYRRIGYILGKLLKLKSFAEFRIKAKAAVAILK